MQDTESHVEPGGHQPGHGAGHHRREGRRHRRDLGHDQGRGHRRPEGEAAIHRQVREVEDAEGEIDPHRHKGEDEADLDGADQRHPAHEGLLNAVKDATR